MSYAINSYRSAASTLNIDTPNHGAETPDIPKTFVRYQNLAQQIRVLEHETQGKSVNEKTAQHYKDLLEEIFKLDRILEADLQDTSLVEKIAGTIKPQIPNKFSNLRNELNLHSDTAHPLGTDKIFYAPPPLSPSTLSAIKEVDISPEARALYDEAIAATHQYDDTHNKISGSSLHNMVLQEISKSGNTKQLAPLLQTYLLLSGTAETAIKPSVVRDFLNSTDIPPAEVAQHFHNLDPQTQTKIKSTLHSVEDKFFIEEDSNIKGLALLIGDPLFTSLHAQQRVETIDTFFKVLSGFEAMAPVEKQALLNQVQKDASLKQVIQALPDGSNSSLNTKVEGDALNAMLRVAQYRSAYTETSNETVRLMMQENVYEMMTSDDYLALSPAQQKYAMDMLVANRGIFSSEKRPLYGMEEDGSFLAIADAQKDMKPDGTKIDN